MCCTDVLDEALTVKAWVLLNREGIVCGKHRVARLRKLDCIEARRKKHFRVMHAYQHTEPPAANLVNRVFTVDAPNQVWVGDITTLRTREGWLYLAIVLDLFARRIVGWSMGTTQAATLPIAALKMAIAQRQRPIGVVCYTDQGTVYGSSDYRDVLTEHSLVASMSRRGNCHDNAVAESFFSNLKNEITHHVIYDTRQQAMSAISDYIELYYNCLRLHQTLGYRTSMETEKRHRVLVENVYQNRGNSARVSCSHVGITAWFAKSSTRRCGC
ncbi:IS3 family transposase [Actimicrobium sp. CCI2.3]|uniref:IS3 family transposase n=1 Tax=Actimicrobium sp. CCI2.3 TaxID=3048616 RepID=UPI002AB483DD|nr:IS3 family transposase [Actimicrobium sp. CCI2.3]MDY7576706.1 IS3 family transposase [Actimicrobium sp. CCI2.3]